MVCLINYLYYSPFIAVMEFSSDQTAARCLFIFQQGGLFIVDQRNSFRCPLCQCLPELRRLASEVLQIPFTRHFAITAGKGNELNVFMSTHHSMAQLALCDPTYQYLTSIKHSGQIQEQVVGVKLPDIFPVTDTLVTIHSRVYQLVIYGPCSADLSY